MARCCGFPPSPCGGVLLLDLRPLCGLLWPFVPGRSVSAWIGFSGPGWLCSAWPLKGRSRYRCRLSGHRWRGGWRSRPDQPVSVTVTQTNTLGLPGSFSRAWPFWSWLWPARHQDIGPACLLGLALGAGRGCREAVSGSATSGKHGRTPVQSGAEWCTMVAPLPPTLKP